MNQPPELSVIIPTHNRRKKLVAALQALANQRYPADRFEVIVVADACDDDTESMFTELTATLPFAARLYSHAARSASLTRNRGAQEARGTHLLFLDDDIIASPELVAAHMDLKEEMRVVLGYSKPFIPQAPTWWQLSARIWWEDRFAEMRVPGYRFNYRDFFSGNVSLPANLFKRVGGFDPAVGNRLEDYELGYRLIATGAHFLHQPLALGHHHDFSNLELWMSRIRLEGQANVQMSRLHNELASQLLSMPDEETERTKRFFRRLAFSKHRWSEAVIHPLLQVAQLCEYLRLRGPYWYVTAALREYFYWSGIASTGGIRALRSMLQESCVLPTLDSGAPDLDMAALPDEQTISNILALAEQSGLRLSYEGNEFMTLAPVHGYESLRREHIDYMFHAYLQRRFVPAVALNMLNIKVQ